MMYRFNTVPNRISTSFILYKLTKRFPDSYEIAKDQKKEKNGTKLVG
jgi:hypothetical protein